MIHERTPAFHQVSVQSLVQVFPLAQLYVSSGCMAEGIPQPESCTLPIIDANKHTHLPVVDLGVVFSSLGQGSGEWWAVGWDSLREDG